MAPDKEGKGRRSRASTKIQFVELERTGEDTIWSVLMQFGTAQATHNARRAGRSAHGGTPGPMHNADPAAGPLGRQHDDLGAGLHQELLREPALLGGSRCELDAELLHRELVGPYAVKGTVEDWVELPFNEAAYGSNYCGSIVCVARHPAAARGRPERLVPAAGRGRQDGRRRSTLTWRSSTSGTATTTTATATSTSRTATSTTSRRSTPARARRPAAARRARTPSGAIARTRTSAGTAPSARPSTSSAASRSAARTTGSSTTRSSRRTAASASSRTSSATTSASRTSTTRRATPAAPRTRPASGRPGRAARTEATARRRTGSATGRSR